MPLPSFAKERLISLLPMLCLVHCVGTAVLASAMPAAALWMRSEWLEGLLSLLSALLTGAMVLRRRPSAGIIAPFGATLLLGISGWVWDLSWLRHGSLLLLVGVQLLLLRQRHFHAHLWGEGANAHAHTHSHASCSCAAAERAANASG